MRDGRTRLYGRIEKVEEQDDGTVIVHGIASSEARDVDGELIRADAMKAALPDYLKFPAIREMHQATTAAGTAVEAAVEDDGVTRIAAHVVDPVAVKKVQTKVYRGFSIGGRVTKRNKDDPSIIEGLTLTEISLVDRPANPDASFTLVKVEDSVPETIQKGMYDVGQLASVVQALAYLQQSAAWEKEMEGDQSAIPAKLAAAVANLGDVLVEMTQEEVAELAGAAIAMAAKCATADAEAMMTKLTKSADESAAAANGGEPAAVPAADPAPAPEPAAPPAPDVEVPSPATPDGAAVAATGLAAGDEAKLVPGVNTPPATPVPTQVETPDGSAPVTLHLADAGGDVKKAGAKFSSATKGALAAIHKAMTDASASMKDCCEKLAGLGWMDKDDDGGDDMAMADAGGDLAKAAAGLRDELAKVTAALAKAEAERDTLAAESARLVDYMKKSGALKEVAKGADTVAGVGKADADDPNETAVDAVKKAHRKPQVVYVAPAAPRA